MGEHLLTLLEKIYKDQTECRTRYLKYRVSKKKGGNFVNERGWELHCCHMNGKLEL